MRPGDTPTESQPTSIRGLYGYDIERVWWEQCDAIIYRGRRKIDGQPLLIKLLKGSAEEDRLRREFQIAQGIASDRIVKPFALEQTDFGSALIYPDEGARPLEELAVKAPLDVETTLTIGASIAEAVAALHKERCVHCCLNPSTVWLDADGKRALISDFGHARCLSKEGRDSLPLADELIDVRYISPEQTGRLQIAIDQRTDIYSLGIILFRLLTGKLPFDGDDPMHIIDGHLARQPTLPAELRDALPAGLFKVILKALAKSPELRYLTANGLVADLVECRTLLRSTGNLDAFEPGRHDAKAVLRVSRRLYGRDRQITALSDKVKSVRRGRQALLLVSGLPGVGKSALLGQLEGIVRKEGGRFASGKFDQYKRNVPYFALIEAFEQIIGQLLSEPKEQLGAWRSRILSAVGNNAGVVINVIPELQRITGTQPPAPSLSPVQARNRFKHVFVKLIQALAPSDQLLCIVMDDLQWVDRASLELLTHVLTDPDTSNILFAGAYRDTEVGPAHSLMVTIDTLKTSRVDVETVCLTELTEPDVLQLIEDTFSVRSAEALDLAQVLHRKTDGDPLFLNQFLHLLCDEGFIAFEYRSGKWAWDLAGIQQQAITQDVLELLNLRFAGLPKNVQTVLATAACIGVSFDANKVAIAAASPLSEVLQCMRTAVNEGLIIVLEESAQRFRFIHDRVQQVSFDWMADQEKKAFRLHIGRRLLAENEILAPEALSNLNYGWELIGDAEEQLNVARLNLVAGRRARQALAYQNALGYLSIGIALLGPEGWHRCYQVAFELHSEAFECEYLAGNIKGADKLFKVLIANANSKIDKAKTYRTKILLDASEERHASAIEAAIQALKLFNIHYVRKASWPPLLLELIMVRLRLRGRRSKDLANVAELVDAEKLAALRVLATLFPTTYVLSHRLFVFNALKIVNYSLRHGISPISAGGFAALGFVMRGGYDFGQFALALAERSKDPSILCPVLYGTTAMIKPWRDPIDEVFPLFDRLRTLAIEAGENQYANLAITTSMAVRISRGSSLPELLRECEGYNSFVLASKDLLAAEALRITRNFVFALQGDSPAPYSLSYGEEAAELRYRKRGNLTVLALQYIIRTSVACIFGRYKDALCLSEKAEAVIRSARGLPNFADHHLYRGLIAAVALTDPNPKSKGNRKVLQHCLARLHVFARKSPHNFSQHEMLLRAETARMKNQFGDALKYYNRAIEFAEAEGYTHLVGLGNERAAVCCLANDERRLASWYIASARAAYGKWGASAKIAWLDRQYSDLLAASVRSSNGDNNHPPPLTEAVIDST